MIEGFNQPLPLWRDLFKDKVKANALAQELQKIPVDKKVIRWPAGTGGKTYIFEEQLTMDFLGFCMIAGIKKISIVINPSDPDGFYKTYEILSEFLEVILLEYDNENYLRSHIQKSIKFNEIFLLIFNYPKLLTKKANEYKRNYKLKQASINTYNGGKPIVEKIIAPLAFVSDLPNDYKSSIWYNVMKDQGNNAIVHVYGQPDNKGFIGGLISSLDEMKTNDIWITEYNGVHFGDNMQHPKNSHLEFSETHYQLTQRILQVAITNKNVKGIFFHCLFDINKPGIKLNHYRRFTINPDNSITDHFKNYL